MPCIFLYNIGGDGTLIPRNDDDDDADDDELSHTFLEVSLGH